ncbi:MAG: alanine racemase [Candidatus Woesearchaeota archaeon]
MNITPHTHPLVQDFLTQESLIFSLMEKSARTTHIRFPEIFAENIRLFKKHLPQNAHIFLAHKATNSPRFVQTAKEEGIGIDVSTKEELRHAIKHGFAGTSINCTGPKSRDFLSEALTHSCVITVDSFAELRRLSEFEQSATILVRVQDPKIGEREFIEKKSKFGVFKQELPQIYDFFLKHKNLRFKGFHFHKDGYDAQSKAEIIEYFLTEIINARKQSLWPDTLNMGGGIKAPIFQDARQWLTYIHELEKSLLEYQPLPTWGEHSFGLYKNAHGKIMGRVEAESVATATNPIEYMTKIFSYKTAHEISVQNLLIECGVQVWFEPGYALLYNAGCSIVPIIETRKYEDYKLTVLNTNIFDMSTKMFPLLTDPYILGVQDSEKIQTYLSGNLCREDDILSYRQFTVPKNISEKNLLVFCNTGAYTQSYESANPQLHAKPFYVSAQKKKTTWELQEHDI